MDVSGYDPSWQAIDPPQRRECTLVAVRRLLRRAALVQPIFVVFVDLHWIDSETQAFFFSVAATPELYTLSLHDALPISAPPHRRAPGCAPGPPPHPPRRGAARSEEHTSELQSQSNLVCRLLLEKKKRISPSWTCRAMIPRGRPSTRPNAGSAHWSRSGACSGARPWSSRSSWSSWISTGLTPRPRLFFLVSRRPPSSTLFPYTTLFRSQRLLTVGHPDVPQVPRRTRRAAVQQDRKSTRLNSSHSQISYAVFCLKKKNVSRPHGRVGL